MMRIFPMGLLVALITGGALLADEPKPNDTKESSLTKESDERIREALKVVHNKGADLYNETRDFAGAYRLYQGSLLTIRPLLANRPAAQKIIDEGLITAEKDSLPAQKAYKLHETIEAVRELLKVGEPAPKREEAKPVEKKPVQEPTKPKTDTTKPKAETKPQPQFIVAPPPREKK